MATITKFNIIRKEMYQRPVSLLQRAFSVGQMSAKPQETVNKSSPAASSSTQVNPNVPGLSQAVVTTAEPVGPGASKTGEYKVPEYFNYNKNSYFEAEVEMLKYRLPQPSALNK